MEFHSLLALIVATAVLVAIPGPNVALIVANTIARGLRHGAVTVCGTTLGVALQLSVVVLGLAALLEFAAWAFVWLKMIGAGYLLWLGVQAWRRGIEALDAGAPVMRSPARLFWQGLVLAVVNPKTLLFNAAFLPQFVASDGAAGGLVVVSAVYLAVLFAGDLLWAATAQAARPALMRLGRLRHRLTAGVYWAAGLGMVLARAER